VTDAVEAKMNALGFVDGGGGDWTTDRIKYPAGAAMWVWKHPGLASDGRCMVDWLGHYPPGTWIADPQLTSADLHAGKGVAFPDPVAAAVWLRTEYPEQFT